MLRVYTQRFEEEERVRKTWTDELECEQLRMRERSVFISDTKKKEPKVLGYRFSSIEIELQVCFLSNPEENEEKKS